MPKGQRHPPFTSETAAKIGNPSKAGKRSGEVRRLRKTMREWAMIMRDIPASGNPDITQGAKVVQRMYREAMKGDVKAAQFLSELMGEMETKIEIMKIPKLVDDV